MLHTGRDSVEMLTRSKAPALVIRAVPYSVQACPLSGCSVRGGKDTMYPGALSEVSEV